MFHLKPITPEAIDDALRKAERYRFLNEPQLAESICQDILDIDPENTEAIIIKLLAITDQFGDPTGPGVQPARQLLSKLKTEYEREYYDGIICERQGNACLRRGRPGDHHTAYDWLMDAMDHF